MNNRQPQNVNMNNKDRTAEAVPDKNKNPDKARDANKINPDSTKGKGDSCGC